MTEDEQWVLDAPNSKYLSGHSDIDTAELEKMAEESLQKMEEEEFVAVDDIKMDGTDVI